jgi:Tfp pilus assembly protein PilN
MLLDQINLTTRKRIDYRVRYLLYGATAVFIAVISLANLVQGVQLYRERVDYQRKLTALQEQIRNIEAAGGGDRAIKPKIYQALMDRGLKGNRLIALDRFPWVKVLDALEKAIPDAVIIDSFRPAADFMRINLDGRTESLEKLVDFQKRLEDTDLFTSVILENMGIGKSGQDEGQDSSSYRMAFKLRCRLRLERVLPKEDHGALWLALQQTAPER